MDNNDKVTDEDIRTVWINEYPNVDLDNKTITLKFSWPDDRVYPPSHDDFMDKLSEFADRNGYHML